uniref:IncF plasmid conjugative transfer pilus assembly protein TraB n=1 Tax=Klebsiella pneumoniae TaxID=573 RepID=A0A8B0SW49_KLEPN|nr:IncF plasmid conjugative transfer pilus assembly protein TraB [Klebsiella pneumoniae]
MKTLKLKELWEENKAIRIAFFACPSISGSCDGNHHAYGRR